MTRRKFEKSELRPERIQLRDRARGFALQTGNWDFQPVRPDSGRELLRGVFDTPDPQMVGRLSELLGRVAAELEVDAGLAVDHGVLTVTFGAKTGVVAEGELAFAGVVQSVLPGMTPTPVASATAG